jgi:DnaJ-class molecular chaperone
MDYYQVLGLKDTATTEEIKSAYIKLVTQYHPDKNPNDKEAEEKTKKINEAYQVLKDPQKKSQYDITLKTGQAHQAGNGPGFYSHRYSNVPEEVLRDLFPNGAFESFFKMSGFSFDNKPKETRNRDMNISLGISIEDAFKGTEKIAQVKEGIELKTLSVTIPKGVRTGMRLRLKGQAPRINLNLPAGDLIAQIAIQHSNEYAIVNDNLVGILKVSPIDALIGTKVEFKNIDDEIIIVDVPEGTRHTEYVKVQGKGMTFVDSVDRSDLLLQVQTTPINNLPERLRKKLVKIADELKKK